MQSVVGIVAISFILAAAAVSFVLNHLLHWMFQNLAIVDRPLLGDRFTATTAMAAVLAFGTAFVLWRMPRINTLAQEVVAELKKVSWPSWLETRASTVVVIITSIIVSLVLGFFDMCFNWMVERIF